MEGVQSVATALKSVHWEPSSHWRGVKMSKMKYDVVVVGGRIAGSVSSLFASRGGADVLMIEKRQEIGTPVQCAEGTTPATFETLEMKPSKRFVASKIDGADVHAPDGRKFQIAGENSKGYILERKIFDKDLAVESAKSGTDIMMKTTVKDLIIRDGKVCGVVAEHMGKSVEIEADLVIAADGVESRVAKMAGLNTTKLPGDIYSCAQYEVVGLNTPPNWLKFYFGEEIAPGGYAWIFPKGKHRANVGLGIRGSNKTAYSYLQKFMSQFSATPVELKVGGVPLSGVVSKTFTDGLMVVGDAAGQVDPITGGGIHLAAACGRMAGEVAAEAVEVGDSSSKFLKKYEDIWSEKIGGNLETSLKYRRILDKLTDKDINIIVEFLETQDFEAISKLAALKFMGKHPNLLKVLKEIL